MTGILNLLMGASSRPSDSYFEYTTLLLPGNGTNGAQNNTFLDGSTNNFAITRNGNTTQGTFSPFSQTGWGNYFDGTNDYLTTPSNTAFTLGTGDFTIECWFNRTGANTGSMLLIDFRTAEPSVAPYIGVYGSGASGGLALQLEYYVNGATRIVTTTAPNANEWYHVAVIRSSGVTKMYLNGSQVGSDYTDANNYVGSSPVIGGRFAATSGDYRSWFGYISNMRVVKGVAVYTGAFTPPTSPLAATQSAGTNISAITGTQTSLLTCQSNRFIDNSTNNFTITANGNTSVVAFSPFNPTASWSAATYGGSGYFDGNGDYLTAPSNAAFQLGSQDFTVELSIYINAFDSSGTWFVGPWGNTSGTNRGWVFAYVAGGTGVVFNYSTNGTNSVQTQSSTTLLTKTWYHFAAVRNGNTLTIYQNGQSIASSSMTGVTIYANTNDVYLGRNPEDIGQVFQTNGYISNMRIVKGAAVYTGNFTPPIAPITNAGSTSAASYPSTINVNTSFASSATSLLLKFTNAGIYDATSKNDLETVGNAQISTTQSKWGGSSISFDGTGDWLLIPDQPPQRIGTGNFTVEMWVYRNSSGTYGLAGKGTGTTGWLVSLNSSNQVVFTYGSSTITSSGTVSATTWTHIAVVREGTSTNQTKIYISGTNDGTGTVSTDFNQTNSMYIGADRTGGSAANAYVQDVRITNYARYTGNFTAPTAAFPTL